jgi:hypothetical protein
MPTQIFISGKNWKLSLAELTAYFQTNQENFEATFVSKEFFTFNLKQEITAIDDLGGTIKIGTPQAEFPNRMHKHAFLKKTTSQAKHKS